MAVVRLSYTPAEAGATVTGVRVYPDPDRTGTPSASGIPTLTTGVWTFSPDLADGDYYTAWDVTDSTGSFTDADDFFYVLHGEVAPASTVVSMAELREVVGELTKDSDPLLLRLLQATVRHVQRRYGLLPAEVEPVVVDRPTGTVVLPHSHVDAVSVTRHGEPVPVTVNRAAGLVYGVGYGPVTITYSVEVGEDVKRAVLYAVQHAYESQQGAVPVPFNSGGDETFTTSRGFFLPNRSKELLEAASPHTGIG